jgi:hypothetical protein
VTVNVDELRRRLDVPPELVDDVMLLACLDVAQEGISPWLAADAYTTYRASVDEGVYQLAVKVWDTGTKGTSSVDAVGEFMMPAPSATPGLVRSVFGVLGPALKQGGLSV